MIEYIPTSILEIEVYNGFTIYDILEMIFC